MTAARHWDLVYGRPSSPSWDGVLLLVAFLLHTPLFFMKMKAPPERRDPSENYVRIENIQDIMRRVPFDTRAMLRPPETLEATRINKLNLSDLLKNRPALPLPSPVLPKTPDLKGIRLPAAGAAPVAPDLTAVPSTVGGLSGAGGAGGLGVRPGAGGKGPLVGKEFTAATGSLGGIGNGTGPTLVGGRAGTGLAVPVSQRGTAEGGLTGPMAIVPKIGGVGGGIVGPGAVGGGGGLVNSKSGVATRVPATVEVDPSSLPVIEVRARTGAGTTVSKSMFPIVGPLANRKIKFSEPPEFPEWARKEGVEATVILKFTVLPNGKVKDNIVVDKTTGYKELDRLAMEALSTWVFDKLPGETNEEQVSLITMKFSLK